MSLLKNLPDSLHGPLKSFVKELEGHLVFLNSICLEDDSTTEEIELIRKKLEGRFHLIRGGAGFFKLESLMTLGKKGEELFKVAKGDREKFKDLIEKFLVEARTEIEKSFAELKAELNL